MDTVESSNQYVSGMAGRSSQRISLYIIDKRPVEEIRKNRTDGEKYTPDDKKDCRHIEQNTTYLKILLIVCKET